MHYSSGKSRISKDIVNAICKWENENSATNSLCDKRERANHQLTLVSLFCGGLSVELKLAEYFDKVICNDKQEYLIALYKDMQNGVFVPPNTLSEDEYYYVKQHKDENKALTGFVGFGCSFAGKWFGGYGRHGTKDYHALEKCMCEESKRALLRDLQIFKDFEFTCSDYTDVILPDGCVIYADPPYRNKMAAYGINEKFDSNEFWNYIRNISSNHDVFISELEAPSDFECIWERQILRQIDNCNNNNFVSKEKLFILRS